MMRKSDRAGMLVLCAALLPLPSLAGYPHDARMPARPAPAAPGHWYMAGSAALTGADSTFEYGMLQDKAEYDLGWGVAAYAGYAFANGLRAEVEIGSRTNQIANIDTTLAADRGQTRSEVFMVNALYDLKNRSRFTPYAGGGVGAAYISHGMVQMVAGNTMHDEDLVFAGQLIAGLSYTLGRRWDAFMDYRHLWTASHAARNSGGTAIDGAYTSQAVNFGLRYNF